MKKIVYLLSVLLSLGVASCGDNNDDDLLDDTGSGITIDEDTEVCCTGQQAYETALFLQKLKPIEGLTTSLGELYEVTAYTTTGSLHVGYNDVYFVAIRKRDGNYVKKLSVEGLTPTMHMSTGVVHSTPVVGEVTTLDDRRPAIKRAWVSFVMNSGDAGSWDISYELSSNGENATVDAAPIVVDALPSGQEWIKSFKIEKTLADGTTESHQYFVSLVNPLDWSTGTNTIRAYVSEVGEDRTVPYTLASEEFTIEFVPTMPDMGNHTSPDNQALVSAADGVYEGKVNLTMTGLWRLHLTIRDKDGQVVAGGDNLSDGYSSLYFDVTL